MRAPVEVTLPSQRVDAVSPTPSCRRTETTAEDTTALIAATSRSLKVTLCWDIPLYIAVALRDARRTEPLCWLSLQFPWLPVCLPSNGA
jgi:hypothetical protein